MKVIFAPIYIFLSLVDRLGLGHHINIGLTEGRRWDKIFDI